jgi:putative peptide zinc metalloprotease protein
MVKTLFSQQWYKVADIKPKMKRHSEIVRHIYRDQVWYVLKDKLTGHHHRFSPIAYQLISEMDGEKTMQSIWESSVARLGPDAPTQDEALQLLGQLHSVDVLASDVPPDFYDLFKRYENQKTQKWKQRLLSPLAIKIPLVDPDAALTKMADTVKPLFSVIGLVFWFVVVIWALVTAGVHWAELTQNISDTVMSPQNIIIMALLFPIIKALHEFGHAFAVKVWGGEVHEMGVMLLVFMPIPYVDASSASAFRESHKRFIVGAAGMMVELAIAALALSVWLDTDVSIVKTIAYNVILITGVSTVFFNANPLLRFDGYYMLADLLQIPNLFSRANKFVIYLMQRYLFGMDHADSPVLVRSEKKWFVVYAIASFIYRSLLSIFISIFIASKFFVIGVILALWSMFTMFVLPVFKGAWFLIQDSRLGAHRKRAIASVACIGLLLIATLGWYPFPSWTNAEGVVPLPDKSLIRSNVSCVATQYLTPPGENVIPGQTLLQCEDPFLEKEMMVLKFKLDEAEVNYVAALSENPLDAELMLEEIQTIHSEIAHLEEQINGFTIRSGAPGRFFIPSDQDLVDQYLEKGQVVGYVIPSESMTVRTVVTQHDAGRVRNDTQWIELRRISNIDVVYSGELHREVPGAGEQLPSSVLGTSGGGTIAVDPRHPDGLLTFDKVFQFDVKVLSEVVPDVFEERVYVRFHHGSEPIVQQWYDKIRMILREEFDV